MVLTLLTAFFHFTKGIEISNWWWLFTFIFDVVMFSRSKIFTFNYHSKKKEKGGKGRLNS